MIFMTLMILMTPMIRMILMTFMMLMIYICVCMYASMDDANARRLPCSAPLYRECRAHSAMRSRTNTQGAT